MAINGINLGLGNSFDAQNQQADLSKYMTDEQFKNLMALQDPSNNLALQKQAASAAADAPQLHFGGNTFAEGLGNGIGNFYAMRGYKQQQQAYKDIAAQQQAYQQQELSRRVGAGRLLPAKLQSLYYASNPEAQDKLLGDYTTQEIGNTNIVPKSKLESDAKIAANQAELNDKRTRFHALTGIYPEQLFAQGNKGQFTPQIQSAWQYTYGGEAPKDLNDFQKRFLDLQKSSTDAQFAPQEKQANLDNQLLSNAKAQNDLKYADGLKQVELLTAQNKLEEAQKLKQHLEEGKTRYEQALANYQHMTPGEVKLFNSQYKSMGLPYVLPEKGELKAVTKGGKVTQFYDPYTGQTRLPDGK